MPESGNKHQSSREAIQAQVLALLLAWDIDPTAALRALGER